VALYPRPDEHSREIIVGTPEYREAQIDGLAALLWDADGVDRDRVVPLAVHLFTELDDWGVWEAMALRQATTRITGRRRKA
jgi:hypothetical protein